MLIENGVWKGYDRSDLENGVLRIPEEVHEVDLRAIHKNMFAYCGGGKQYELFVDPNNPVYYSEGNCMIERETGKIVFGTAESKLPQDGSVRSIGTGALAWCDFGDRKIDIPGSIENVEKCAFYVELTSRRHSHSLFLLRAFSARIICGARQKKVFCPPPEKHPPREPRKKNAF